ncbi:hypothetical protein M501DRAFT_1012129 [Patellaria atrata CBS 101060]|uniref:Phosphoglycerate mutase-like protein n=1 Tax=Patellaria atrata CBS 101060 TaxID=1346257 RepID=A0A9P4VWI4_9PEZI|nr:hypothetical protein M501DRAFT_1012129 [Patellaria atrata CBS 101060]
MQRAKQSPKDLPTSPRNRSRNRQSHAADDADRGREFRGRCQRGSEMGSGPLLARHVYPSVQTHPTPTTPSFKPQSHIPVSPSWPILTCISHLTSNYHTTLTRPPPENSDKPCDTGLPPVPALSLLHSTPPHIPSTHPLSLSLATLPSTYPLYPAKTGPFAFTRRAILARGHDALSALSTREEKVIAVVSHSGFLRTAVAGMWFRNGDFRVFEFEDGGVGLGEVRDWKAGRGLRESEETRERGGGLGGSRKEPAGIERMDFPEEGVGERAGDEPAVEVPGKGEGK